MTETRERVQVASSARDPIDRWLDMLVRLLRVPRADAQRIRDELEDHLRARVDDLMLTGHPEPDAVRLAVTELGETAELARQFQTASKPHRRLTMLAGSAIVSIGLITSAMLLSPLNAPPQRSGAAIAAADMSSDRAATEPRVFAADLAAESDTDFARLGDAVGMLENLLGARVIAHYRVICEPGGGVGPQDDIEPIPFKGMTLEQGLEHLTVAVHLPSEDPLVLSKAENAYELAPQSFFDRRDAVLIEYDVRTLLSPPDGSFIEPIVFQDTITSLIEPTLWGDRTRLGMISTTMIVNAHPRIHVQIMDLFARIEARYDQQLDAMRAGRKQMLADRLAQFAAEIEGYSEGLAKVDSELDAARSSRRAVRERIFRLEFVASEATGDDFVPFRLEQAEAEDALREAENRIIDLVEHRSRLLHSQSVTRGQIRETEAEFAVLADPEG